ncbi:MAG: right-handed parallel beta-helix repeat-containing protein [Planctomycetota bacterium]|jgi:hypothetical protein
MYNELSSPELVNCTFSGNSANFGSGMFNNSSSPTVINCAFSGNSAGSGGGMYSQIGSSPTVTNCTFSGNMANDNGGGLYNDNSSPELVNCTFSGNNAVQTGGGMYNNNSSPTVTNCTFSGNMANDNGGGLYNGNSSPELVNCTFSGNNAVQTGGGMYNNNSSPTLTNCVLWGNTAANGNEIYNNSSTPVISYCDITGCGGSGAWDSSFGTDGGGNIDADPLFKDADDDLSLSFDSPCIDAGDNNSVPADTADLDGDGDTGERTPRDLAGNARFTDDPYVVDTGNPPGADAIVEMGAYERYEFCGSGVYLHPDGDISGPDGIPDCRVDFFDFAVVAAHWLEDARPE